MEWRTLKEYIPLAVHWSHEGDLDYNGDVVPHLTPTCLHLEAGGVYEVDRVRMDGVMPSFRSGGYGKRYTARVSCDAEENYNKVYYLYYESHGQLGRWRWEDEYVSVDVIWHTDGSIIPVALYLSGHRYVIDKRGIIMYRMSTRKTDGAGMRYIFRATCGFLRDYNREFSLMLENGGKLTGRWYCEDAEVVHRRKVKLCELSDGYFDERLIEEAMGVAWVCARFQAIAGATNLLREWNADGGQWLPAEDFEKKLGNSVIYPNYYYPVMIAGASGVETAVMRWGLERSWASGSIFNLRCDKLIAKNTFGAIKGNRCVIACGGFYEYQKDGKTVVSDNLFKSGERTTYLAGLYEQVEDGDRFAVITTDANISCADVHDRMPVILRRSEVRAWLTGKLDFAQVGDRKDLLLLKEERA